MFGNIFSDESKLSLGLHFDFIGVEAWSDAAVKETLIPKEPGLIKTSHNKAFWVRDVETYSTIKQKLLLLKVMTLLGNINFLISRNTV